MALTDATKTALSAVKKIFVYVKSDAFPAVYKTDADKTDAVISLSKNNPTKIYFVEPTSQIITQGQAFGVDASWKSKVDSYIDSNDSALTKLVGTDLDGINKDSFAITSDSIIAKYVNDKITEIKKSLENGKISSISAEDNSIIVGGNAVSPTLKVHVDGTSIVLDNTTEDKGLQVKLKFESKEVLEPSKSDPTTNIKNHYLVLEDSVGNEITKFQTDEFINDAMVDSVVYDDTTGNLTITWNTASGKSKPTEINLKELLKVSSIDGDDYIKVETGTRTNEGTPYTISATVGTSFGGLTYTAPVYDSTGAVITSESLTYTQATAEGLADATTVSSALNSLYDDSYRMYKSHKALEAKVTDISNEIATTVTDAIKTETDRATAAEQVNKEAIDDNFKLIETLNGDETVDGSVAKSVKDGIDTLTSSVFGTHEETKVYEDGKDGVISVEVAQENGLLSYVNVDAKIALVTKKLPSGISDPENHTKIGDNYYDFMDLTDVTPDPSLALAQDVRIGLEITKTNATKTAEESILEALAVWDPWEVPTNFNGGSSTGGDTKPDDGTVNGANGLKNALDNDGSTTNDLSANLNGDTYGTADTQSTITAKSVELKDGTIAGSIKISTID